MKNSLLSVAGIVLFLIVSFEAVTAQEKRLELKGDTIYVSERVRPFVMFIDNVTSNELSQPSCFIMQSSGRGFKINPGRGAADCKACALSVIEGNGDDARFHLFWVVYKKEADRDVYDYSTRELLEQAIASLKERKAGKRSVDAGGNDRESKRKKNRKNSDDTEIQNDEKPTVKEQKSVQPAAEEKEEGSESLSIKKSEPTEIDGVPVAQINDRTRQVIQWFYGRCKKLSERVPPAKLYISQGMELFRNDSSKVVEVTLGAGGKRESKPVLQYLKAFGNVRYKSVKLRQSNVVFVTGLHRINDRTYKGSAIVKQVYEGLDGEGQVKYRGVDEKTFDVFVDVFHETKDGETVRRFEVYLGDISVNQEKNQVASTN